jgi:hypothetical protein
LRMMAEEAPSASWEAGAVQEYMSELVKHAFLVGAGDSSRRGYHKLPMTDSNKYTHGHLDLEANARILLKDMGLIP